MLSSFFFNDTATTEIYTLSLHDALPIYAACRARRRDRGGSALMAKKNVDPLKAKQARQKKIAIGGGVLLAAVMAFQDRKSTRLNSSHANISYAAFCLNKKDTRFLCHQTL